MRTLIVFNHPYEGSFCNALLQSVISGLKKNQNEVDVIYLDKEDFNPVMTAADLKAFRDKQPIDPKVLEYKQRLERADHLVFIFPIWWELMPALTKGFIDKVMFPGVAYDYTNKANTQMKPLLNLKKITLITTMNTPKWLYYLLFGNAIKKALLLGTFFKMGYRNLNWISYNNVKKVTPKKRAQWLAKLEQRFVTK